MRFLDTDIQINSETIFSLLKPVIPSPLTTGLLCLAGGISYYSWNYYKNKKQELNVNFVPKNNKENEIKQIKRETSINDIKNIITNNKSNINKKEKLCEDKINLAKTEEETVWDENNLVVAKERQEEIIKINVSVTEQEIEGFTEMDLDETEEETVWDENNLVVAKERQEEIIKINVSVTEQEIEGFTEMDLDETEEEIMLDNINNDDDKWEMLSISSNSSNCL